MENLTFQLLDSSIIYFGITFSSLCRKNSISFFWMCAEREFRALDKNEQFMLIHTKTLALTMIPLSHSLYIIIALTSH